MDYLPIFCQLHDKPCLLVGGGEIAERKARLLLDAGAVITVNALDFNDQFRAWEKDAQLTLVHSTFDPALLNEVWLVIAATDNQDVNNHVYASASERRIFCNVVDSPERASFIMPSIIDRSPLMVAVSSGGTAPVLARLLREKLESILPQNLGKLAAFAGELRSRVKIRFCKMSARRRFWEKLFVHDRLAQALASEDRERVQQLTELLFSAPLDDRGEVTLVGAGPGDAGLLTLKGLQHLQQADIVVYDRLVSKEILNLSRRDAERIFVGKASGYHSVPQDQINQLLEEKARAGHRVVRLKGGDPFIFGRGAEELEYLQQAGVPFSVVPGITAASGCSAYSGIPLTHRDHSQGVRLITGHVKHDTDLDWSSLAAEKQTLVFYMGLQQAEHIQNKLIEQQLPETVPVAIIENGTSTKQRVLSGQLSQLGELAQQASSPSLIIIGNVVGLREKLSWFSDQTA
ncbi:siroheme synthase [includes: uroporphyrin-III C-methyltransferase; precorrin-2 oxidase; ferrochelatase] [Pectobacterium atrosepticum SCRI1043]|uniref:Siroheme synthase 2 n=1 Tax=Pectobacterium atrosepticum (strain SCRI 1043 / ATCC BAA-672) TaxID=218491 RepID=CYSG2_PECAS|nr:siroheme synthase CysG [Pectobacterium atrosepticum]Q6CZS0.1 RecName: Full=Siroheme synthase 2; Includes: RecName: Full=Uroporphyrinogen-III C-methyltransferase 2; Short=Urogen III methylase 2; AltName: Full=SUMT 2; AltName: Full=Uroporphyrinogen III methylase 2; Short=UROM 2; Includes: RecName: Full=Precorrin-2 dehydrogenase 2; Includes: RecName: Full=Sirohydrochlorin ferrochelatase 2 [Pectobacterium atrosepticum SCRI1043]MCL6318440.1 uroporphyrinogen-III C-methyltransferase [Pectobacterium a